MSTSPSDAMMTGLGPLSVRMVPDAIFRLFTT